MEKIELLERYVEKLIKEKSECLYELKISDIENEIQCVADIAKLVYREENTPAGSIKNVNSETQSVIEDVKITKKDGTTSILINGIEFADRAIKYSFDIDEYYPSLKLDIKLDGVNVVIETA